MIKTVTVSLPPPPSHFHSVSFWVHTSLGEISQILQRSLVERQYVSMQANSVYARICTQPHAYTDISLCNANSQRDNFIWWKGILERANWISPGSLKNPYHGERSHHVIIRFIEAHSFNLPPFSRAHCIQGPGQWLGDKRELWANNTWKSHKDLAGFVTEMEQDFVCVNNVSE